MSNPVRFRKASPCPICHGYDALPHGQGQRCYGFLSTDGEYAHCTREEHAGSLTPDPNGDTYAHRLIGDCKCGERHDPAPPQTSSNGSRAIIIATYDYVNGDGALLYQTVRYQPKDFKQRRPDGHGGWLWNLQGVRSVIYRLPDVLEAIAQDKTICLAEGEEDVEVLRLFGYTATCNHGGAGKWSDVHSRFLEGATDVVCFGDNDEAGRKHLQKQIASLRTVGIVPRIAQMDDLPNHGDIRDWLKNHTQEHLDQIVATALAAEDEPEAKPMKRPMIVHADQVTAQTIQWLWPPYLPCSMLVMLDGDPGLGKGLMLIQTATNLSKEHPFPDQCGKFTLRPDLTGPQTTLILSAEDSIEYVMVPRLKQAGADLRYIKFLTGWLGPDDDEHMFDLGDMPVLIDAIKETQPTLVILDPLVAYLGEIDMHRANETRPVMTALRRVAEKHACTILGVRHPGKTDQGGRLMYRGQGNMDIVGASRSALWVQPHPTHPETQTIMLQSKTNVGHLGRTMIFSREEGLFKWVGVSRLTERMLTGKGPDPWALLDAFFWLEESMTPGIPYRGDELEKKAKDDEDINPRTLARAKKLLNIHSDKQGEQWYWRLPAL